MAISAKCPFSPVGSRFAAADLPFGLQRMNLVCVLIFRPAFQPAADGGVMRRGDGGDLPNLVHGRPAWPRFVIQDSYVLHGGKEIGAANWAARPTAKHPDTPVP